MIRGTTAWLTTIWAFASPRKRHRVGILLDFKCLKAGQVCVDGLSDTCDPDASGGECVGICM